MDQVAEAKRKELELNILKVIREKLNSGELSAEKVQAIAKMILKELHPPLTLEQIYAIVPTLDDQFTELTTAILPLMNEDHERIREVVSSHTQKLINDKKIDEALAYINEKVQK